MNGDVPSGDVRMFRYCCLTFEVIMDDLPWSGDMKVCVAIVVFLDVIMTAFAVSKQFTLQTTYSLDFEVSCAGTPLVFKSISSQYISQGNASRCQSMLSSLFSRHGSTTLCS